MQITVSGRTLFGVALVYYGDPLQWTVIAQANALTDPWLSGVVTLEIPTLPQQAMVSNGG
jgi:nucleoid-associated protein YgaU